MTTTVASFNVENLFSRPRAFSAESDSAGEQVLADYREFNALIGKAIYTDAARVNETEGSVRLKVTLLANGQVGSIIPVTTLPHGLTEQAVAAARQIKFEPKKMDGIPVSTTVTIDYSFEIY